MKSLKQVLKEIKDIPEGNWQLDENTVANAINKAVKELVKSKLEEAMEAF